MDAKIFAAMQTGEPLKTYKKNVPTNVLVRVIDPLSNKPTEVILKGEDEDSRIDLWDEGGQAFFEKMNKALLKDGTLTLYSAPKKEVEKLIEESTDEEVVELVHRPYMVIRSIAKTTNSEPFLLRLINAAKEQDRSDKIVGLFENRLAEVQNNSISDSEDE